MRFRPIITLLILTFSLTSCAWWTTLLGSPASSNSVNTNLNLGTQGVDTSSENEQNIETNRGRVTGRDSTTSNASTSTGNVKIENGVGNISVIIILIVSTLCSILVGLFISSPRDIKRIRELENQLIDEVKEND